MDLKNYFNNDNLHHAYLIEGDRDAVVPALFSYLNDLSIQTVGNPDLYNIQVDAFKIDDARILKSLTSEKSFSNNGQGKKIFILVANSFLLEAQNSLLKVFEEPIPNTHFFIIAPSAQTFIPTLLSRLYVIKSVPEDDKGMSEAEEFIKLPLPKKLDFIKELVAKEDDEDVTGADSPRAKALHFLNDLEHVLHQKFIGNKDKNKTVYFNQIFKARKYLRQPGSATKSLMESVALSIQEK